MSDPLVWRNFTKAALDAAYNNMAAVSDSQKWLDNWTARSAVVRAGAKAVCDQRYGMADRQCFDLFRCDQPNAPLIVFIHGGWWQRNSKNVFSCMALGPLAHGCDVALIGYTLAPEARLSQIVGEIFTGIDEIMKYQASLLRQTTCVLSGWSAGGHLASTALGHPAVRAGVSISGVFDLEPIRHSYINDKLQLDTNEVTQFSPARAGLAPKPFLAFAGDSELPELKRQTAELAAGRDQVDVMMLPGHNHFSILDEMENPDGRIAQALAEITKHS